MLGPSASRSHLANFVSLWAKDAPVDADSVIVSIPQKNTPDLAEGIVATRKPGAPVIETNNYYPRQRDGRIALPIAGDGPAEKQIVSDLVDQIGFDPVDAGTPAESWRQQPDTPIDGKDFGAEGVKKALAEASPERADAFRAAA